MADLLESLGLNTDNKEKLGEDFDFIDSGSLRSSFKKKSDQTQLEETKRRALIHTQENEDDPLADLSDDEYFPKKSKSLTVARKSSLMNDLFGIKLSETDLKKNEEKSQVRQMDQIFKDDKPIDLKREPLRKQTNVDSGLKTTDETNLNNKQKLANENSKKSALMKDLLENLSSSKDAYRNSAKVGLERPSSKSPFSFETTEQDSSSLLTSGYAPSRDSRRRRGSAIANADPLGLFLSSSTGKAPDIQDPVVAELSGTQIENNKKVSVNEDLPEWLGGGPSKLTEIKSVEPIKGEKVLAEKTGARNNSIEDGTRGQTSTDKIYPEHLPILMSSQFEQQSAIIAMQQQEHELRTAATLSRQNDYLSNLLNNQKSILNEQEKQFSNLIRKQMERQALLESQMKAQQSRIDQHIQTLMAQPTITTFHEKEFQAKLDEREADSESLLQKLQLEKSYLENTLESMRAKHQREISILEESHKKQISFLEEMMEKLEKRMRYEAECMEANYETKLEKLREEKQQMETFYKEEIENNKKLHAKYINDIYEQHARNVELLRKEYLEVFDHISQIKHSENQIVSNITSHRTDIDNMLDKTKTIIDSISIISEKLQDKHDQFTETKENILKKHDEYLETQQQGLNKQNKIIEEEHYKIIQTMHKIDVQMTQLTSDFQNRMKYEKETEERLKKKEEFLMWEREQFEEKVKLERNHFQALKESWVKEQERQLKILLEEKESLTTDKARLEVLSRLKLNNNDIAKAELEAAIQAAEEAINNTNKEKQKWREKVNELEIQQKFLDEKESQLVLRAKELENLTQSALVKREEGLKALKEAKRLEANHKEKLKQFQTQIEGLTQRENKMIADKFYLARDRLSSLTVQIEQPERDSKNNKNHGLSNSSMTMPDINSYSLAHFKDIVDPHLVMLKFDLDQKLDSTNEHFPAKYRS